jgi:protein SCO1/2
VDQRDRPFDSRELAGRVWIASFLFTRCEAACADVTRELARVQARARNLEPALHLVSFSVDPEHDSPERLSRFAREQRASPRMWSFLTGSADAVRAVERALGPGDDRAPALASPAGIPHGAGLVLVDGASRIRGRYDARAPDEVDRLVRDAALLVNRPP